MGRDLIGAPRDGDPLRRVAGLRELDELDRPTNEQRSRAAAIRLRARVGLAVRHSAS